MPIGIKRHTIHVTLISTTMRISIRVAGCTRPCQNNRIVPRFEMLDADRRIWRSRNDKRVSRRTVSRNRDTVPAIDGDFHQRASRGIILKQITRLSRRVRKRTGSASAAVARVRYRSTGGTRKNRRVVFLSSNDTSVGYVYFGIHAISRGRAGSVSYARPIVFYMTAKRQTKRKFFTLRCFGFLQRSSATRSKHPMNTVIGHGLPHKYWQ